MERALEHDTPSVLFRQALDFFRTEQIVRPGLDRLMRAIGTARTTADDTIAHLSPARFEQINPYGQYRFDITEVRERQRHPLRDP